MKTINLKIRFDAERFLAPVYNMVETMIRRQLADVPILYRERADDGAGYVTTVVYMHSVRQEREGRRCRYKVIAYEHPPGAEPAARIVRAYTMEYPLIRNSHLIRGAEYTAPEPEALWTPQATK